MNKSISFIVFSCTLTFGHVVFGKDNLSQDGTLCKLNEDVYFSCPIKGTGKTASLCAAGNTDPGHGYVQYRYGAAGKLEFVYPKVATAPGDGFHLTDVSEGSMRGLHVKFSNGKYQYVLSSMQPGGVYVMHGGKKILDKDCGTSANKSFSFKAYKGIKQTPIENIDNS